MEGPEFSGERRSAERPRLSPSSGSCGGRRSVPAPNIRPVATSAVLPCELLEAVSLLVGVSFDRRLFTEQPTEVKKMLMRHRPLNQRHRPPLVDKLRSRHPISQSVSSHQWRGASLTQLPSPAASQSTNSRGPTILTPWYSPRLRSWRSPVTRWLASPVTAVDSIRSASGVVAMPSTSAN